MSLFDTPKEPAVFELGIDDLAKAYMLQTVRWTKFMAIVGLIFCGLLLLASLIMLLAIPYRVNTAVVPAGVLFAIYFTGALLYVYPSLELLRFSRKLQRGLLAANSDQFNAAMKHQRNMWRFIGVLTIVTFCLYAVVIVLAGIGIYYR